MRVHHCSGKVPEVLASRTTAGLPRVSLLQIFNKQYDHILCRLIRCLENQLSNMSCMGSGEGIHLERPTACQSSVHRLDTTNGELLAQLGPTVSNIAEGNLSTHERWPL